MYNPFSIDLQIDWNLTIHYTAMFAFVLTAYQHFKDVTSCVKTNQTSVKDNLFSIFDLNLK